MIKRMLDNFYRYSPVLIQNVMCSVYGLKLYKERYTGIWREYFDYLTGFESATEDEILLLQNQKLRRTLLLAMENVPYYRDTFQGLQLDGEEEPADVLRSLPVLEKDVFRGNQKDFLSSKYDQSKLLKIYTSGSTGNPMGVLVSVNARRRNYAFFGRAKKWAGIEGFPASVTFAGRLIVPGNQDKPPYWRVNKFFNNYLFSSYHLDEFSLPYYVAKMRQIQPVLIDSYPSSLYPVAKYILDQEINDLRPRAIITSSETLIGYQREVIESAFQCKVSDQYGSAEQVVFACQCEKGRYHLSPEYGYLEVVDNANQPVPDGEIGSLVCTGFINDAMPLIRYKIGDIGAIGRGKCICGRNFHVLQEIVGRKDDILVTPHGRYIGRLGPIFKGVGAEIRETQIVQREKDLVEILLVKDTGYKEENGARIVDELKNRMGNDIIFNIHYVDSIPRDKNGKFRTVINKIGKNSRT